jgi:phage tail-like protein
MAAAGNVGDRKDPLPVFCFKVEFDFAKGPASAFFKSVSGLRYETEVIPVISGGTNNTTYQLPGATKWANIVLKQGFTGASQLLDWREQWINGKFQRCDGTIIQLDTALNRKASWSWFGGWPCKWDVGEFDATKSELSIETLEISIHGLKFAK